MHPLRIRAGKNKEGGNMLKNNTKKQQQREKAIGSKQNYRIHHIPSQHCRLFTFSITLYLI